MKVLKAFISFLITIVLIFILNRSWNFGSPIPPLGKFLDPFHGFWKNAETLSLKSRVLKLDGVKADVSIIYDSLKIAHIFAKSDGDLYFAQGYITARDRLWQMEFQTLAGAGRISEIIGEVALDFDRSQRRLGMTYAAENALHMMEGDPSSSLMIDSYGKGVNAYIESLRYEDLPIEYKLLDYRPELWTNLKVALVQVNMAKTLNLSEKDIEMSNALRLFGKETLDILYPDNEHVGESIVDNPGKWNFSPIKPDSTPMVLPDQLVAHRQTEKTSPNTGSNNWAVSGMKTATGSPMLCNDPHLELSLPSIWYVIHLNAPGVNVMGASLPGSPAVISGFNDSIAWGITNAQRDLVDWYKVRFKDSTRTEYLSDGKWRSTQKRIEKFGINGSNDFYDTVVYTHHGPIIYDKRFHPEDSRHQLAFRWITHDPAMSFLTFHLLNRGKNHGDYLKALNHFDLPAQNFVFASVSGDIAMRVQGKYPIRRKEEGKFILDGTKTSTEWKAFIPDEQNIVDKNPARGFVSSANQYPSDTTYPYYIYANSFEAYRNRRINKVLSGLNNIQPADLMHLQFDMFNLKASESLPYFLIQLDTVRFSPTESSAFQKLKTWNFYNVVDSEGASYFEAFWKRVYALTWDEMNNPKAVLEFPTDYTTIRLIKEKPEFEFFDIKETPQKETAREVIQQAFREGVSNIEKWKQAHPSAQGVRWADYKDTYVGHLMRGLPAFSYHIQHGGNGNIVNASSRTNGPSWRMVVSMEPGGVKAWGVYPGGQSGNPGSPFYNNQLENWSVGKYFSFYFKPKADDMKNNILSKLTINPSK